MATRQSTKPAIFAALLTGTSASIRSERSEPLFRELDIQRATRLLSSPESLERNDRQIVDQCSSQFGLSELIEQPEFKKQVLNISYDLAMDPRFQIAFMENNIVQRVLSNNLEESNSRLEEDIYQLDDMIRESHENSKLDCDVNDNQTNMIPPQVFHQNQMCEEKNTSHSEEDEDDDLSFLECPICLDIPFLVHSIDCRGGHSFCGECIKKVYQRDPRCPLCDNVFSTMSYVRMMDEMIRAKVSRLEKKYSKDPKFFAKQMTMRSFLQRYDELRIRDHESVDVSRDNTEDTTSVENMRQAEIFDNDTNHVNVNQNSTNQNNTNQNSTNQNNTNQNNNQRQSSNEKSSWQELTFAAVVGAVLILVLAYFRR